MLQYQHYHVCIFQVWWLISLNDDSSLQIFLLNSRLAAAESMTHDVIRDLLGIKLDMNNCAVIFLSENFFKLSFSRWFS